MDQSPDAPDVAPLNLSIVIPVYNSELSLANLLSRLCDVLPGIAQLYEVILVNDGSSDNSWQIVSELATRYPWVVGINLTRNFGQHNALLCGIRAARYAALITMDDDLQHPPEEIPKLLARLSEGYDVVYGPPLEEQHDLLRNLASIVIKMALKSAMGVKNARNASAFRALRTSVREGFADYNGPFVSIDVLLTWGTNRFSSVQVRHEPRTLGTSNYTIGKLLRLAFNMITGFTVRPLQAASLMGFGFALFGALVLLYVLGRYLIEGGSVPGFPFLASIIALFSGVQLLALGVIGEYLARMHFRLMDRPPYVTRERLTGQNSAQDST